MVVSQKDAKREIRATRAVALEPPPTPEQLERFETEIKPALEKAVSEATTDQVEQAARRGSKIAAAELESRGITPPTTEVDPFVPKSAPTKAKPGETPSEIEPEKEKAEVKKVRVISKAEPVFPPTPLKVGKVAGGRIPPEPAPKIKVQPDTGPIFSREEKAVFEKASERAPETVDEHNQKYFTERGWDFFLNRGAAPQEEVVLFDWHLREATKAYVDRYGERAALGRQGAARFIEAFVPGFWAVKASEMSLQNKIINGVIDVLILAALFSPLAPKARPIAATRNLFKTASKSKAAIKKAKALNAEYNSTMEIYETGLRRADAGFIEQAGKDLQRLARASGKDGGSKALQRQGKLIEQQADDIADYVRQTRDTPLSSREKAMLRNELEKHSETLVSLEETFNKRVKPEILKEGTVITAAPEPPRITPPGEMGIRPGAGPKVIVRGSSGERVGIPRNAFQTMTPEQVARIYGVTVAAVTKAIATQRISIPGEMLPGEAPGVQPIKKPTPEKPGKPEPPAKPGKVPKPRPTPRPRPMPKPEPTPKPSPKPAPRPAPKPKPGEAPTPAPSLAPAPSPKPAPRPAPKPTPKTIPGAPIEPIPEAPTKPRLLKKIPVGAGKTDKQKRKIIRKADGAITWRHGELRGKDVWQVGVFPYNRKENWLTVLGRKPANATLADGPGSAFQTIKLLHGKPPPRKVRADLGIFDVGLEARGRKGVDIRFKPDPKQETTGDFSIGRLKETQITERKPRLSGRGNMRITPKRPKLRR
jgi:hypothetical protein